MVMYLVFLSFILVSVLIIIKEVKHFLSVLVGCELLLLSVFGLARVMRQSSVPIGVAGRFRVIVLCLGVCESCIGLGVLTSMGRSKGGSKVYGLCSFKV
mgnify:CR=1 FL=1